MWICYQCWQRWWQRQPAGSMAAEGLRRHMAPWRHLLASVNMYALRTVLSALLMSWRGSPCSHVCLQIIASPTAVVLLLAAVLTLATDFAQCRVRNSVEPGVLKDVLSHISTMPQAHEARAAIEKWTLDTLRAVAASHDDRHSGHHKSPHTPLAHAARELID